MYTYNFIFPKGLSSTRLSHNNEELPSPRLISTTIHPYIMGNQSNFTLALMQWGQFIDHDITHTPLTKGIFFNKIK